MDGKPVLMKYRTDPAVASKSGQNLVIELITSPRKSKVLTGGHKPALVESGRWLFGKREEKHARPGAGLAPCVARKGAYANRVVIGFALRLLRTG